jgi:hypothetical protein
MAYLLNGIDLYNTYNIRAGHSPGSNIALSGCFDLPERVGECFHDWGDEDSVEPFVLADEMFFAGRDITLYGSILGTASGLNGCLKAFYNDIAVGFAAPGSPESSPPTSLVIFSTPYISASGYVKSVTPEYMNGGCSLEMTFREPVVNLTGTLPASGISSYTIDSIPFLSFGLYLSKAEALHDLPELKDQFFTRYGAEGWQVVKRKNKTLDINGFIIGSSLTDFQSKIQSLYKVFSSAGTRSIVINSETIVCFAIEGFKVDNITFFDKGVIARFKISLLVISVI